MSAGCKFSQLEQGQYCYLTLGEGATCDCGALLPPDRTVIAIYEGHATEGEAFDVFTITSGFACPGCKQDIKKFRSRCRALGTWPWTADVTLRNNQ